MKHDSPYIEKRNKAISAIRKALKEKLPSAARVLEEKPYDDKTAPGWDGGARGSVVVDKLSEMGIDYIIVYETLGRDVFVHTIVDRGVKTDYSAEDRDRQREFNRRLQRIGNPTDNEVRMYLDEMVARRGIFSAHRMMIEEEYKSRDIHRFFSELYVPRHHDGRALEIVSKVKPRAEPNKRFGSVYFNGILKPLILLLHPNFGNSFARLVKQPNDEREESWT